MPLDSINIRLQPVFSLTQALFRRRWPIFVNVRTLKTLEKRTPANNYEQPAHNWGTRGRGFKSRQPDKKTHALNSRVREPTPIK